MKVPQTSKGATNRLLLVQEEGCSKPGINKAKGAEAEKNDVEIEIDHPYGLAGERRQRDGIRRER